MNSLIKIAAVMVFAVVASGNLPKILKQIHKALYELIMDLKASRWPKAMTLPSR